MVKVDLPSLKRVCPLALTPFSSANQLIIILRMELENFPKVVPSVMVLIVPHGVSFAIFKEQKINPISVRLNLNRSSDSSWLPPNCTCKFPRRQLI